MKLILKLKDVPKGRYVTKVTGSAVYTVSDSVVIHGVNPTTVTATPGTRFLISENSFSITSMTDTTDVAVIGDASELCDILHDIIDIEDSK